MKRVLCMVAILGLAACAFTSSALARSSTTAACPATAPMIAGVTYTVAADTSVGVLGNVWATDTYTRTVLVYRVSATTYCVILRDAGTFTTVAGRSPGGGGTVAAGLRGKMSGNVVTNTFSGQWSPVKTSGSLGTFAAPIDWLPYFFNDVDGYTLNWWSWTFACWSTRSDAPSVGDLRTA